MRDKIKYYEYVIWGLVVLIIITLLVSSIAYRSVYGGELSDNASDWGSFGGFFGGIFSPLIAFATLIAIIVTINLQKELLSRQTIEFDRLLSMQSHELELFKKQSFEQSLQEHKRLYLSLLEQQIEIRRSNMLRASENATYLLEKELDGHHIEKVAIESNLEQKELYERQVQVLTQVSIYFTINKFDSVKKMDTSIKKLFRLIENKNELEKLYKSDGKSFMDVEK
ncbi:hypothetical protein [Vibrio campbellii]|uniref:hypothetical protein n=1 Tax=Vibrio campbellii TaxID=680 RepID=UPI004056FE3E